MNAPESDDTAAYRPVWTSDGDDAQQTAAFEPGSFNQDTTPSNRVTEESPSSGYGSTWNAAPASPPPPAPAGPPANVTFQAAPAAHGIRGFVLGLIAVLLILTVFLLWTWATLLDQETRESIQDLFGFIG